MAIREIAKVGVCLEPHRESLRGRTGALSAGGRFPARFEAAPSARLAPRQRGHRGCGVRPIGHPDGRAGGGILRG